MVHSDDMGRGQEDDQETAKRSKEATAHPCPPQAHRRRGVNPGSVSENPDKQEKGAPQIT